jgi:hypothetical protein
MRPRINDHVPVRRSPTLMLTGSVEKNVANVPRTAEPNATTPLIAGLTIGDKLPAPATVATTEADDVNTLVDASPGGSQGTPQPDLEDRDLPGAAAQ